MNSNLILLDCACNLRPRICFQIKTQKVYRNSPTKVLLHTKHKIDTATLNKDDIIILRYSNIVTITVSEKWTTESVSLIGVLFFVVLFYYKVMSGRPYA